MFGREIKLICRFRKSIINDLRERLRKTGVVLVSVLETNCKIILDVCLLQHLNGGVFFFFPRRRCGKSVYLRRCRFQLWMSYRESFNQIQLIHVIIGQRNVRISLLDHCMVHTRNNKIDDFSSMNILFLWRKRRKLLLNF